MARSAASAGRCRRTCLDLSGLTGVTLYEPEELVLSARAGTPIAEIEALLDRASAEVRLRADGLRAAARRASRARHDRRRAGGESVRAAPDQGGRGARPYPRHPCRLGARRGVQVRRAGGQERHRLRPVQGAGGLVGHAGRRHRRDLQGAAGGGDRDDARHARARRRAGGRCHGGGDGIERARCRRAAHLPPSVRARARRRADGTGGDAAPAGRLRAVGRLPRSDADRAACRAGRDRGCWTRRSRGSCGARSAIACLSPTAPSVRSGASRWRRARAGRWSRRCGSHAGATSSTTGRAG